MTIDRLVHILTTSADDLEQQWERHPESEELGLALTVKDFMRDYGIEDAREGVRSFLAFKERQSQSIGQACVPTLPLS